MKEGELSWIAKWEEDLPSPEELMPLSQSLITPNLALAFGIPTTNATKKPRLVWTPQLHKSFVDAIARLGVKNAVPKNIMQLMNVEGLTRENVASHLQKYRLHLKRMQSYQSASLFAVDAATDRLFATAPVPSQFLGAFVPVAAMQQYQPIAAAAAAQQNQYQQESHMGMMIREAPQMLLPEQPMQNPYVQYLGLGGEDRRRVLKLFPTGLDWGKGFP